MTIDFTLVRKAPARSELHGIPVSTEQLEDEADDRLDWALLKGRGFEARVGQVQIVGHDGKALVAAVGVGSADDVDARVIRRAGAALVRAARRQKNIASSLLAALPEDADAATVASAAQAHAEGVVIGAYKYNELKNDGSTNDVASVAVVGTGGAKVKDALVLGAKIGSAVGMARDLVNEPGGSLTPVKMAGIASRMAKREKLKIKVMDLAAIKKAKFGGVLGVNRGSTQHPRFVELTYQPKGKAKGHLVLVGKGITFDAGGLSIKSGTGMMTMKCDMAGAAAVIAAMSAVPAIAPKAKVTAYVPMTDNMLGGDATRPGDVLTIRNGKTVEVLNTDAEGRLVLADALSLASETKPDAIIDLATLTGAAVAALGQQYAALMDTNDPFAQQVSAAADRADEKLWRMPLPSEYRSQLDSSVADLKNIGTSYGGSLTAGLFLKEFVADGIPWAHLDIAGPAWTDVDSGMRTKGGTGYGVRLLLELISSFEPPVTED